MKHVLTIIILLCLKVYCKAQTPVIPLNGGSSYGAISGAYYKDTEDFFWQFEGTWVYSNNGTILKIVLKNKDMFYEDGIGINFYTDYIIGEYQYIKDGIEILNTLHNLNINHEEISQYNITGNTQIRGTLVPAACPECQHGEKRLLTYYTEPGARNVVGLDTEMVFRRFTENGVTKLKIWFYRVSGSYRVTWDGQPTDIETHLLPYGEYVLTKQ
ncbi:DUF6705 family protein [Flavobacterium microcysteis]|uniref:DUF6705 domain-containing protein n=1 Tax=Flavobacterium microcysteis TaxID=2596891 RepID=A0A501Q2S7_9FLAO|nr:DUF6705 family protein [Flavobacterium microcysteis]TPD67179.1 hypothetical protein FJA49_12930 [Flavobacterium microcysteis]